MMRGTPTGAPDALDAIAHAAVHLASDEAAFVHATVIDVDVDVGRRRRPRRSRRRGDLRGLIRRGQARQR
jgi:hypothetical protein